MGTQGRMLTGQSGVQEQPCQEVRRDARCGACRTWAMLKVTAEVGVAIVVMGACRIYMEARLEVPCVLSMSSM